MLTAEEEAAVVAFRKHMLLPLDDCLYALQATIPPLTRSALHRCFQRHGISRLPEVAGDNASRQPFKRYPIGYFHIDIAEVRTDEGTIPRIQLPNLCELCLRQITIEFRSTLSQEFSIGVLCFCRFISFQPRSSLKQCLTKEYGTILLETPHSVYKCDKVFSVHFRAWRSLIFEDLHYSLQRMRRIARKLCL